MYGVFLVMKVFTVYSYSSADMRSGGVVHPP